MQPDLIKLDLDPDETRPHQPLPPRRPPPPEPAIVGIMAHVWRWLAWLAVGFFAYTQLKINGHFSPWSIDSLAFLGMMALTGWFGRKKDSWALETATLILITVAFLLS